MNEQIILDGPKKKFIKLSKMNKKMLTNEILKFIESNNNTFYATEITDFVNRKLNWNYSAQFVKNFMKNELIFSYKKVNSRPKSVDFDRLNWLRTLFSIKFSQLMSQSTLLINIDETSIGRNTKVNYSWWLRGYPIEAKNIFITSSVSFWMALLSNGSWISMFIDSRFNNDKFALFIQHLIKWLETNNNFGFNEVIIIMDNWSIHP